MEENGNTKSTKPRNCATIWMGEMPKNEWNEWMDEWKTERKKRVRELKWKKREVKFYAKRKQGRKWMCQLIWIWRVAAQRRLSFSCSVGVCIYVHDHVTSTNCTHQPANQRPNQFNMYSYTLLYVGLLVNKDVIKNFRVFYMWILHSSIYDLRSLCGAYPSNRLCDTVSVVREHESEWVSEGR